MWLILGAVLLSIIIYFYGIKPLNYWKERGVKQGNPWPILGDNWGPLLKIKSFPDMIQKVYKIAPGSRYCGMYQYTVPTLVLKDPDLIKQITIKDFDHFVDHRSLFPEDADPVFDKNLFALTGQKWRDMRAVLSPSFTSSKMRTMFQLMKEVSENFTGYFLKQNSPSIQLDLKDAFTRFANDVIATTAFGIKIDSLEEKDNQFFLMGKEATNLNGFWKNFKFFLFLVLPKISKIFKITFIDKNMTKFFQRIISTNIKERESKKINRNDMINLLLEARKGKVTNDETPLIDTGFATVEESNIGRQKPVREITDDDITSQALVFFFAGFDSVSNFMCFMCYELAANPDIQDRLRKEIQETFENCNGKLTYEVLLQMKYLDMVTSETLRKWPNAVAVDRICTKPYTIQPTRPDETPVHLKVNDIILLPIFAIHRDENIWPNPEKFDPERFNDENKKKIQPYTFIPFGSGPRNCIGSRFALLETKTAIFHILKNFKIVPNKKSQIPIKLSKQNFTLSSEKGFWFDLQRI